jgi:hypothetical protein
MARNKTRGQTVSAYLGATKNKTVEAICKRLKLTVNAVINLALDDYIKKEERKK